MLHYLRFRGAGAWMTGTHDHGQAYLSRSAPLPPALRRLTVDAAERAYDPDVLGRSLGGLLRVPPPIDVRHMRSPRVTVGERLEVLRGLLRRHAGTFSFDAAVEGADRVTTAMTVWALLELYKRGEAAWDQDEPFGPITIRATEPDPVAAVDAA
jgi:segregation and condensation protein A